MVTDYAPSSVVQTARGPMEYAQSGPADEPRAVAVLHGVLGGYDQGLLAARLDGDKFKIIAVSRPGYLRTPIAVGKTPEEQAEAVAALLDQLRIDSAAVMGFSAGGPAALQFALRYPQRCWALVLISAVTHAKAGINQSALSRVFAAVRLRWRSNFLDHVALSLLKSTPKRAMALFGNRLEARKLADAAIRSRVLQLFDSMFPIEPRLCGTLNDLEQIKHLGEYPLERIPCPTLVVHGSADHLVPFAHAEFALSSIPNAELLKLENGSHFAAIVSASTVGAKVFQFLEVHAPQHP